MLNKARVLCLPFFPNRKYLFTSAHSKMASPRGLGTPPDSVIQDIQTLNKFNNEQFAQLLDLIFEFLKETRKSQEFSIHLDEFSEQHGVKASALKVLVKSIIYVPTNALKRNTSLTQLQSDLINFGLASDKTEIFVQKWQNSYSGLSRAAVAKTLNVNQLVDMEWKFGVTAGSSEFNRVGSTFLQLKLVISTGNKLENVYMELTLPQFYAFLHQMERAKTSLEYFS